MIQRSVLLGMSAVAVILSTSLSKADCVDAFYARQGGGSLTPQQAAALSKTMLGDAAFKACQAKGQTPVRVAARPAKSTPATDPALEREARNYPEPPEYGHTFYPLLRRDFNDVWLFQKQDKVDDIKDAEGAQFGISSDRVAKNTVWNVNAMAAVVYQLNHQRPPLGSSFNFIGLSIAPFVAMDRVHNSNPTALKNNVDEIKFGGSAEIGFDMLGGGQYFRARGKSVNDRIASTTTGSAVLEWIPVYDNLLNSPIAPAAVPVVFAVLSELKVRYDNVVINDVLGTKGFVWRWGPQVGLRYKFNALALAPLPKQLEFLKSLHGQTTYSWLMDAHSSRHYSYFNSSLTYNVDSDGHVGLTGSYTKGRSEDTGRQMDIWKAGLTAKW